jgi:hypothetical protein
MRPTISAKETYFKCKVSNETYYQCLSQFQGNPPHTTWGPHKVSNETYYQCKRDLSLRHTCSTPQTQASQDHTCT